MQKLSGFNSERLKSARMYRGLTLTELANQIGISKQALSQFENPLSNVRPEFQNSLKLAEVLNFPRDFFFTEEKIKVSADATYFRSLLSADKKDRAAQRIKLEYIAQIYVYLSQYLEFPKLNILEETPDKEYEYEYTTDQELDILEQMAMDLRVYWNLGNGPIENLKFVLESNGIIFSAVPSDSNKIDAFSQKIKITSGDLYIVAISNSNQSIARARFDMAHEMAHIILHPWSEDLELITKEEFKARERQANIFAGAFLLPREPFLKDVSHYPTSLDYYVSLKEKWNVSISAMIYRAHQLEAISYNQYQYLMRTINKKGWKQIEPGDKKYILNNSILQNAFDILIMQGNKQPHQIMDELWDLGIVMYSEELEHLLCLPPGTLKSTEKKPASILKIKDFISEPD